MRYENTIDPRKNKHTLEITKDEGSLALVGLVQNNEPFKHALCYPVRKADVS